MTQFLQSRINKLHTQESVVAASIVGVRRTCCLKLRCYLPSTGPTKIRQSAQSSMITAADVSKR